MKSLISIIVPVYNASATIKCCIESVLSQTYTNFELIIIDDGSTDDSLAICERFAMSDSRIIVKHQENKGVSAARNLGINLCNGEWISFLDSDDFFAESFLEDLITDSSDCDLIIGGYKKKYIKTNQVLQGIQFPNKYIDMDVDCMSIWDDVLIYGTP
ncbi:MAG: glycosyltransferase family 2 protein, partial [Candidatus Limisoma sp.]